MTDQRFVYVPYVTTMLGDRDEVVKGQWYNFLEFNRELACLFFDYTERTPKQGTHLRCSESDAQPLTFARVEDRDQDGRLIGAKLWRNLLSPTWWGDGRNAHTGPGFTDPGYFPNEIGDAA